MTDANIVMCVMRFVIVDQAGFKIQILLVIFKSINEFGKGRFFAVCQYDVICDIVSLVIVLF